MGKPQNSKRIRDIKKLKKDVNKAAGSCNVTKKVIYLNESIANRVVALMWARDASEEIGSLHTFHCEHCGFYHVGHSKW